MRVDTGKGVGQPGLRIDAVELCHFDQRIIPKNFN
jgi:hypothetical protein